MKNVKIENAKIKNVKIENAKIENVKIENGKIKNVESEIRYRVWASVVCFSFGLPKGFETGKFVKSDEILPCSECCCFCFINIALCFQDFCSFLKRFA